MKKTRGKKSRKSVSLAEPKFIRSNDLGTGTQAALAGTVLEPMLNDKGQNPNGIMRRRRKPQSEYWSSAGWLTMRQLQAAQEIEKAYCGVMSLSSGGDSIGSVMKLGTRVQASPKPDANIAVQTSKHARLIRAMYVVPEDTRKVIEHLFRDGLPLSSMFAGRALEGQKKAVIDALTKVADRLRY